jgi:predicted nucleic acid-binding protein
LLTNLSNGLLIAGRPHLRGEVANALYQRSRSREPLRTISVREARESLDDFLAFPIAVESPPRLYEESLLFALTHNLPSIYDSIYVVLARELGTDLWTADQRLLRTVSGVAPWVRSIAGYS